MFTKHDLGILILKLATKKMAAIFENFGPSLRHFMLK